MFECMECDREFRRFGQLVSHLVLRHDYERDDAVAEAYEQMESDADTGDPCDTD